MVVIFILGFSAYVLASSAATLRGTITDSLGAVVQNAKVELIDIDGSKVLQSTKTDASGRYAFTLPNEGRFRIRAEASSFQPAVSEQKFAGATHSAEINLTLSPSVVAQKVVVSATGVPTPEVQTGASISVVDEPSLATRRAVEDELRIEPGVEVDTAGQIGGQTSVRVRGGAADSTKVLIDGVPANDIGGALDFSNLSASGFEKAEIFRGPNSALYGSDALAGVINITTRRGVTPLPELGYSVDGGTYGTLHQDGNVGGAWKRFDYFTDASRFDTQNSTPNSEFHNSSLLGNLGWQLLPGTELRATARRSVSAVNAPSALDLYGIPDDGVSREEDTAFGVTLENRTSERWHNLVRYAGLRFRSQYNNFGPTGIPFDPYDTGYPIYLGNVVTIRGANGYQVTGQGVLQYGPGAYETTVLSDRDSIYAQSDFRLNSMLAGLFGFRYEAEGGFTTYGSSKSPTSRGNYSYMMQLNGGFWNRLYYTVGSGLENNSVFGIAGTPRASLAYYLAKPSDHRILSGTRLAFNFGKGVKEPSIYYQLNSLYYLLETLAPQAGQPTGPQLIQQDGIHPFRAELARTYDGGLQQTLMHGRARVSLTYFHNEFGDQAEFIPFQGLSEFNIPGPVITALENASGEFLSGAALNTLSYRAQGAEVEAEYHIMRNLAVRGGWTYTDAVVQHSYSGMLANAAINPLFPNIPIGAFSPLNGARPFRIAPNTGYFSVDWNAGRASIRMTGTMVSRRDDSTFLFDSSYYYTYTNGNTMLLPNRNLDPSYQKLDLHGSFRISKRVSAYATMENLLNQHYYQAFGYPALPFTIRSGMQFSFGGENWKL
jgi:iron complex outermembrane receptor protein/vitamin B12 transporter